MGLQLIEGFTNPSTYYSGPDEVNLNFLIDRFNSTLISAYTNYEGQRIGLDIRGVFDTSLLTSMPVTFDDLDPYSPTAQFSGYSLSIGANTAFTVHFDPLVNSTQFNRYTEASSNADYSSVLSGNDVYTSNSNGDNQSTFLWGGNDTYIHRHLLQQYNDIVYGGDGIDKVVLDKAYASTTMSAGGVWNQLSQAVDLIGFTVSDQDDVLNTIQLNNIERLAFSDINVALDIGPSQNAGSVYMLYKAAFNRAPDEGGMGYWLAQKDGGANIVTNIAQGFVNSGEFTAKYGANPTNASYVDKLYLNVLGRAGEAEGVAYWNQQLDAGNISKAAVLVQFATLAEGASIVAPLIANGIPYTEWVG